jgi:hypothetical protein
VTATLSAGRENAEKPMARDGRLHFSRAFRVSRPKQKAEPLGGREHGFLRRCSRDAAAAHDRGQLVV